MLWILKDTPKKQSKPISADGRGGVCWSRAADEDDLDPFLPPKPHPCRQSMSSQRKTTKNIENAARVRHAPPPEWGVARVMASLDSSKADLLDGMVF